MQVHPHEKGMLVSKFYKVNSLASPYYVKESPPVVWDGPSLPERSAYDRTGLARFPH
jgi:hypothetical protein